MTQDTASRDIEDLIKRGILRKDAGAAEAQAIRWWTEVEYRASLADLGRSLMGAAPRARKPFSDLSRGACAGRDTLGLRLLTRFFARAKGVKDAFWSKIDAA